MPDYENLLHASLPEALDSAIESLNFKFSDPEALMGADVSAFEELNTRIFAYFNRDDVFYINKAGRHLLNIDDTTFERNPTKSNPIFWLSDDFERASEDRDVIASCRPKHHVRELITLSWGKTWLRGSKFPIRATNGLPLAILFAGREMSSSEQIRHAASAVTQTVKQEGIN